MMKISTFRVRGGVTRIPAIIVLCGLWLAMTDARSDALLVGVPIVALSVLSLSWLGGVGQLPAMGPAVAILPGFLSQSIRGAVEIAALAFGLRTLPSPGRVLWPLALPYGRGRVLFMNMVSLIPGTLSMRDDGESLAVHLIDEASAPEESLRDLEGRVARMWNAGERSVQRA